MVGGDESGEEAQGGIDRGDLPDGRESSMVLRITHVMGPALVGPPHGRSVSQASSSLGAPEGLEGSCELLLTWAGLSPLLRHRTATISDSLRKPTVCRAAEQGGRRRGDI